MNTFIIRHCTREVKRSKSSGDEIEQTAYNAPCLMGSHSCTCHPHVVYPQDLEYYVGNELVNVATHLSTPEGWKPESSCLPGSGV